MLRLIRFGLFLLALTAPVAQAQTSRAATAASYLARGHVWYAKGELDRAIPDYDLAIASESRSALAYYYRGIARQAKGDVDGALADFGRALEIDPRYADAYN